MSHRLTLDQSENLEPHEESKQNIERNLPKSPSAMHKISFKNFIDNVISDPTYKLEMDAQAPSGWLQSLSGSSTWSNREATWLESNSRLVFGVSTKRDLNKWLIIINWIVRSLRNGNNQTIMPLHQQSS